MSTEPISLPRFAEALRDLSIASLQLKVLELRNDIAHLDYSNEQLLPYARGTATTVEGTSGQPDPDCVDAIRENMVVIERRLEQVRLVRVEVEQHRGVAWSVFQSKDEEAAEEVAAARRVAVDQPAETAEEAATRAARAEAALVAAREAAAADGNGDDAAAEDAAVLAGANGSGSTNGTTTTTTTTTGNPWTDGTFQTGTIRNGTLHMDPVPGNGPSGGSLSDEQLRRMLEARFAADAQTNGHADDADDEDGLHL